MTEIVVTMVEGSGHGWTGCHGKWFGVERVSIPLSVQTPTV